MQKKLRVLLIVLGIVAFLVSYSLGAYTRLDPASASKLKEEFMHKIAKINYVGIFANSLAISLIMFIPGIGILFGLFSGYSTGSVFSAIVQTSQHPNQISPLIILLTPFGLIEIFCYGLAVSRSSLLLVSLVKRQNFLQQLTPTLIEVAIVTSVL